MSTLAVRPRRRNLKRSFGSGILPSQADIDDAWFLGFDLGSRDVPGLPPKRWAEEQKRAFEAGYAAGSARRFEDDDRSGIFVTEMERFAAEEEDQSEPWEDDAEFAEMRMARPVEIGGAL